MHAIHPTTTEATTAASSDGEDFTIVIIPDTQYLTQDNPAHFTALVNWIDDNADDRNIQLVLHVGDVVNEPTTSQYDTAATRMATLYGLGIPFLPAIGNHDYGGGSGQPTDHDATTMWNSYFGVDKYEEEDWFGGVATTDESENMYLLTSLGGRPTLVLTVELFPRAATMEWADGVIEDHPLHDVIIVTHSYLGGDGTRVEDDDNAGPDNYPGLTDTTNGEEMWQDHLRQHHNVRAVFSGHHITGDLMAERVDYGDDGNRVFQQFANWQGETEGGEGRIVLLTVNTATGRFSREVYNAALESFDTTTGYEIDQPWATVGVLESDPLADATGLDADLIPKSDGQDGWTYVDAPGQPLRGTAEVADPDTTVDVTHNIGSTPEAGEVGVWPANQHAAESAWWLSDFGSATFRINLVSAAGTDNTAEFHWLYTPADPSEPEPESSVLTYAAHLATLEGDDPPEAPSSGSVLEYAESLAGA